MAVPRVLETYWSVERFYDIVGRWLEIAAFVGNESEAKEIVTRLNSGSEHYRIIKHLSTVIQED